MANPALPQQTATFSVLPETIRLTDAGNAKRLVARFRGRIRYCPPRKKWLVWDEKRWAWDTAGQLVEFAKAMAKGIFDESRDCPDEELRKSTFRWACKSEERSKIISAIALAQSEPGIPVMPNDLDADPWALNVTNGTLDLRTGELREHDPAELITKLADTEYLPGKRSDLWEKYLDDATKGDADLIGYLQRAFGYALQGNVTEKCFWLLFGPPNGTKSTFIEVTSASIGEYAETAAFTTWVVQSHTGGNRGDIVALRGARLVTSVEARKGMKFDEGLIKAVTGGDAIAAAAKYESEIVFRPSFSLWLAANDAPLIRDDDEGAWSRVRRVPFDNPIPEEKQDKTMRQKLKAPDERSAVLAWAVQGCLDWQRSGLGTCAAVEKSNADYRAESDRVVGFFAERCKFERSAKMKVSALRDAYETFCKEEGIRYPLTGKEMAVKLKEKDCEPAKLDGQRAWLGVRLLGDWEAGDDVQDTTDSKDAFSDKLPM